MSRTYPQIALSYTPITLPNKVNQKCGYNLLYKSPSYSHTKKEQHGAEQRLCMCFNWLEWGMGTDTPMKVIYLYVPVVQMT